MDVMTAILTRRSEHYVTEPAPCDEEFARLLRAAAKAPDHGMLRPWRWILIRDDDRKALGECFAAETEPGRRDQVAAKPLRAPLLATLVFAPAQGHKVPEWEQLAATSAMTNSLMLLLHAHGFGSMWRTGVFTESIGARRMLGIQDGERLLGWLYIGTPEVRTVTTSRHAPADITGRLSSFQPGR